MQDSEPTRGDGTGEVGNGSRHGAGANPAGIFRKNNRRGINHMATKQPTTEEQIIKKLADLPIVDIEVSRIRTDGKNPNRMRDEQFKGLVRHIQDNGILNPVIITESMLLADGEHRVRAARELGLPTVPARIIPDDDRLRRILRQTMNKIRGTHDADLDAEEFQALIDADGINDLASYLGEDAGDLLRILDKVIKPVSVNPDDYDLEGAVAEAEKQPITKPGDLIRMGDHILLCGDATKAEDWQKLLGGDNPIMMITDPPYNVSYEGKTADKLKIKNDQMQEEQFLAFLKSFFATAFRHVSGAQYVFMAAMYWGTLHRAFMESGGHWSTTIVWVKSHFTLGFSDMQRQSEPIYVGTGADLRGCKKKIAGQPILYGWKKGGNRLHYDSRTETDVWVADKPNRNAEHPTMKPVTLYRKAMLLSSRPQDIIIDPFCGSGTAVIAAEQTHRKARVMELDPVYCDVIVRRWEEFTGKTAERITDEKQEFAE